MASALLSCHYSTSLSTPKQILPTISTKQITFFNHQRSTSSLYPFGPRCSSQGPAQLPPVHKEKVLLLFERMCFVLSMTLATGLVFGQPTVMGLPAYASPAAPALSDVSVLISEPPVKEPGALLRYALPINNKAIREVQKPLEDITESLKVSGVRALDSVERNVKQASRALKQGRSMILSGLAEAKRDNGKELLDKLEAGLDNLQKIVEEKNREAVAPKQKELLQYVGR